MTSFVAEPQDCVVVEPPNVNRLFRVVTVCASDNFPKRNPELMGGVSTASLSAAVVVGPLKVPD